MVGKNSKTRSATKTPQTILKQGQYVLKKKR